MMLLHAALLFAVSASASTQDFSKPIDYATKAVTFSQAFSDLSKQAGVGLFPEQGMENELIVLRLKNCSVKDAMQKIADTVGGTWEKKPDGYELDRSPDQIDKMRQDALNARTQALRSGIAKQMKDVQADQPFTAERIDKMVAQLMQQSSSANTRSPENWQVISQLQNAMPDEVALLRVLSQVDLSQIAAMPAGERLVFSNKPTNMQKEISADLSQIAENLKNDHNAFVDALKAAKKPDSQGQFISVPDQEIATMPDRFVLTVADQWFGDSLAVSLIVFDGSNHPICEADSNLNLDSQGQDMMAQRARVARQSQNEKEIPVSALTKEMLDYVKRTSGQGGAMETPITGDLRQALLNPDKADPLAFAASEAFLGIAEQRNENLVMYPDDTMFLVAMFGGMEGSFKPSLVLQAVSGLETVLPTTVTEQDGWMTIAPVDRLRTLSERMDRAALGAYLRDLDQNGYLTIASTAKLAASVKGYQLPVLAIFLPMMLDPATQFGMNNDISILKLYSTLSDSQIQRLESDQPIQIGEFTGDQASLLSHFVFERYDPESQYAVEEGASMAQMRARNELTDVLPDGLPIDTVFSMKSSTDKTYICQMTSNNSTFVQSMNVDTMAWYVHSQQHPDASQGDWHPEILSISPGESRTLTFTVVTGKDHNSNTSYKEERKTDGGPWTLDKLPEDLKAQLDKAMQRFNQTPMRGSDSEPAPAPTTTPPPHRENR